MSKFKRKPFFLKGNFQLIFIIGFILLLLLEVIGAGFFIYKLASDKIENAAYSSHLNMNRTMPIIKPVVVKVNFYAILISILLAAGVILITYFRLRSLFGEIIQGLEKLKDGYALFRLKPRGTKKTRELIKEFNQAAAYFDNKLNDLSLTLNSLSTEKDLRQISRLHHKLYSLISSY